MADVYAPPGDVEAAALAYLKPLFPSATVTTRRPYGTDWQNPPATSIIRVQVVGGDAPVALTLDPWVLAVEVWNKDSVIAAQVCGEIVGRLNMWSGRYAGVLIYQCRAQRPRSVPDPATSVPRYLSTASGIARLMGV